MYIQGFKNYQSIGVQSRQKENNDVVIYFSNCIFSIHYFY